MIFKTNSVVVSFSHTPTEITLTINLDTILYKNSSYKFLEYISFFIVTIMAITFQYKSLRKYYLVNRHL